MSKQLKAMVLAVAMSAACIGSMASSAAVSVPDVAPAYVYAADATSELTVSGTKATCTSTAVGVQGETTKIIINQTLQRKTTSGSWQFVAHWNETDTGYLASATNTYSGLSSGTYRLMSKFNIFTDEGMMESITEYSSQVTVSTTS